MPLCCVYKKQKPTRAGRASILGASVNEMWKQDKAEFATFYHTAWIFFRLGDIFIECLIGARAKNSVKATHFLLFKGLKLQI